MINTKWAIKTITGNLSDFLVEKNTRYGNSALESLEGFKFTPEDGIKIRIVDKLKRIVNSDDLRKNDIVDIIGYLILLCVYKEWYSFKELID